MKQSILFLTCLILSMGVATAQSRTVAPAAQKVTIGKTVSVSGTVKDTEGKPVKDAVVTAKGTTTSKTTDASGRFAFDAPAGTSTLVVKCSGYTDTEVKAGTGITIVMKKAGTAAFQPPLSGVTAVQRADIGKIEVQKASIQLAGGVMQLTNALKAIEKERADNGYFQILNYLVVLEKGSMPTPLPVKLWNPNTKLKWHSEDPAVAEVDDRGYITPLQGNKTTVIIATNEEGTFQDECRVYVIDKFLQQGATALGCGINITTAAAVTNKHIEWANPVFDPDLLNAMSKMRVSPQGQLPSYDAVIVSSGKTVSEAVHKMNTENKVSYQGAFSASASVNFSKQSTENRATAFVRAQARVRQKEEEIINSADLKNLEMCITDNFRKAVNSMLAKKVIETFGTHVIARCYWGGLVQVDFTTSSSLITSSSRLEATVKASAFGVSASSNTVTENEKKDFEMHSDLRWERYGGGVYPEPNNVEGLLENYTKWVNSVPSNPQVCGIDAFNENTNMIPIWKIAELFNPSQAGRIKEEFEKKLAEAENTLNGIKVYPPVMTDITVINDKNKKTQKEFPMGYNHAVLYGYTNTNNDQGSFEDGTVHKDILMDANKGAGGSTDDIHVFYRTKQMISGYNGVAIADICVIIATQGSDAQKRSIQAPPGYTKIEYDLNATCGSTTPYIALCYKKATASDTYVVDFIGCYLGTGNNRPNPPAANTADEKWEWVKLPNGGQANITQGAGSNNIGLMMRKVKRADK